MLVASTQIILIFRNVKNLPKKFLQIEYCENYLKQNFQI